MLTLAVLMFHGWSLVEIARTLVIIAAIVGIVIVAMRYFEVWPPPWAVRMFWIVVVAFAALLCINLLAGM